MTEILTESFCERCGTRYTFESAAPRKSRVGRMRTVSKGLRNYVLQDESSLSEAMADARSEEERSATSHQLDAFHKTFNFCMTCRQYTCGNCWNTAEGRCLTCSPVPGSELPPIVLAEAIAPSAGLATNGAVAAGGVEAWPEVDQGPPEGWPEEDLTPDRLARAMGLAGAAEIADPEATGDDAEARGLRGVAPGQSLEDAVAEYEAQIAAEEDAELEAIEAAAEEDAELVASQPAAADEAAEDVEVVAVDEAVAAEAIEVAEPDTATADVDEDLPLAAAAALGAAAVVVSDEEPAIADVEATDDHGVARTLAAGALAAAAWPVGDDESVFTRESQREAREPEAVAAAAQPEPEPAPEPVAAAPELDAEPEPRLEPETVAAAAALAAATDESVRDDVVVQPTWPIDGTAPAAAPEAPTPVEPAPAPQPVAPAQPPTPAPASAPEPVASPWLTVAPDDGTQPEWPAPAPYGRTPGRPDAPMTLAGRRLMPRDDAAALWAASAREVLSAGPASGPAAVAAPTVAAPQPCVSCGLSLSANARFCRRCGTRQA